MCTAWCLGGATASAQADDALRARAGQSISRDKRATAGFRMEGDPDIEMVFGDMRRFREHVDRFFELAQQMQTARSQFGESIHITQSTLAAHRRGCPQDAVALLYAQAYRQGQRYRELGAEFEGHYLAIRRLDQLGETAGLTPDYRWRVRRTERLYKAALVEYREMRAVFDDQLGEDLSYHRCDADAILAVGERALTESEAATAGGEAAKIAAVTPGDPTASATSAERGAASGTAATGKAAADPTAAHAAVATATFFIDNKSCASTLAVFVDGTRLGEVGGRAKAAFQAQPGRHALCVIPSSTPAQCGAPGTLRYAYVHDGWSIAMRCE